MKCTLTEAEIEALKERVEFAAKEAEEAAFTLEMWMMDWRRRMAEKQAPAPNTEATS